MNDVVPIRQGAITLACRALGVLFRAWQRAPHAQPTPRRILVVRRCCLGDVLHTTPLLAALDQAYPTATITYATGEWSRVALTNNQRVDRVQTVPGIPTTRQWLALARQWRHERYDLAVLPERSPLVHLTAFLAGIPRRVGLDSAGRGFALTDRVPVAGVRHETDLALDLARALGLPLPAPRLEYWPGAVATARIDALLAERGVQSPFLVIHPGGGANPGAVMADKRWRPERFAQVADTLQQRHGLTAILVGGASDRAAVDATLAALHTSAVDLCERLSFDELGALCARAALYLGNDSGASDLAEACGVPTVVVFGPTDPAMYGPLDGAGGAVWNEAACAPFVLRGDLTRRQQAQHTRCIDAVTVDDVLAAAERQLHRVFSPGPGPAPAAREAAR